VVGGSLGGTKLGCPIPIGDQETEGDSLDRVVLGVVLGSAALGFPVGARELEGKQPLVGYEVGDVLGAKLGALVGPKETEGNRLLGTDVLGNKVGTTILGPPMMGLKETEGVPLKGMW
jgi:hypothetical protein